MPELPDVDVYEILHAARLSPTQLTRHLNDGEIARLHEATRTTRRAGR